MKIAMRRAAARLGAAAALTLALGGCAHEPVSLEVRSAAPPAAAPIARPIAFFHPQSFREREQPIEPYAQGYVLPLKLGEASDRVLRETYARLFAAPREVGSREELAALARADGAVALLEPTISAFDYLNASRRMHGPYYAEVQYRFALTGADGAAIARWTVRGFGQFDLDAELRARTKDSPPPPRGEAAINIEAPRRAIEAATASFARSFERVPELIRWRRGEPVAGTDVAPERQTTSALGPEQRGALASYAGAFALRAERAPIPKPPKDLSEEAAAAEPNLVAVRLTLENASTHRLALDPADIEWHAGSEVPLEPLPPQVAAALITRLPFGMVVAPGVGVAALPALFAALVSAAELERHRHEFAAWSDAVSAETLADGIAAGGAQRSGVVYFPKLPEREGGVLVVRVVDLDEALRYTVRVRMPEL
ncbi:MAG: hypothetical protein KJ025_06210 [Burkholderiales bacterium]|nr:hypothetical protein [Burkholderiales bacterium]